MEVEDNLHQEETETQIVEETVIQDDGEIIESIIIDNENNIHMTSEQQQEQQELDEQSQQEEEHQVYQVVVEGDGDTQKIVSVESSNQQIEQQQEEEMEQQQQQSDHQHHQHHYEINLQDTSGVSIDDDEEDQEDTQGQHVNILEVNEIQNNQMDQEEEDEDDDDTNNKTIMEQQQQSSSNNNNINNNTSSSSNINNNNSSSRSSSRHIIQSGQIINNNTNQDDIQLGGEGGGEHHEEEDDDEEIREVDTSNENSMSLNEDSCTGDERIIGGDEDEEEDEEEDESESERIETPGLISDDEEEEGENHSCNENRCIVCNTTMNIDDPKNHTEANEKLKKFFYEYLAVSEKLELPGIDTTFPFCEPCRADLDKLMTIAGKIEFMDLQFEKLRDTMARKTVRTYVHRTRPESVREESPEPLLEDINDEPLDQNLPQRQFSLTDLVFKQWKRQYDTILPGRYKRYPSLMRAVDSKQRVTYYRVDPNGKHHFISAVNYDGPDTLPSVNTNNTNNTTTITTSAATTTNTTMPSSAATTIFASQLNNIQRQGIKRPFPMSTVFKINGDTLKRMRTLEHHPEGQIINGGILEAQWQTEEQEPETEEDKKHPYKCTHCPKAFNSKSLLSYHTRIHSGELPFECDICGKGFAVPHYLMIHMRSHTGERPFKCNICEKTFAQRGGLATHALVHSGEKPYTCSECGKSFRQKYHLTQHQLIHSGLKPFTCEICNKSFNVKMNLREHMRRHTGERPYRCSYCNCQGFFRKKMLRDHIVKAHPERPLPDELVELGPTPKFPKNRNIQVQQIQVLSPNKQGLQQRQVVFGNIIKTETIDHTDPLYTTTTTTNVPSHHHHHQQQQQQQQQQQRVIGFRQGQGGQATLISIDVVDDKMPHLDTILEDSNEHHHHGGGSSEKNSSNLDLINVGQQDHGGEAIRLQLVDTMTMHSGPPEPILTDGQQMQITPDS